MTGIDDGVSTRAVENLGVVAAGAVVAGGEGDPAWCLVDADGVGVAAVNTWLADLQASDYSPATLRSYAYDMLSWMRFLAAVQVQWTQASRWEVRDWVRWHQLRLTIRHADRKRDELTRRLATEQPTLIVAEHAQGAQ